MRCWEWDGAKNPKGYGRVWIDGKLMQVHRVVYEEIVGAIPTGLEIDHLCSNRACYNPEHLEAVTHTENVRRGKGTGRSHCPQRHPYSGVNFINTTRPNGHARRECRICHADASRRYRARRKANGIP